MDEGVVDDAWIAKKPKWQRYRSHPVSFAMAAEHRPPEQWHSRGSKGGTG